MRYQEYERKIAKLVKVRNTIYRFRFAIIGVTSAIVASVFALNITKGIITSDIKVDNVIEYGTKLELSSSAFMSSAKVEYKKKGSSSWSKEVPVLVGDYTVRTYSTNSFGVNYFGKEQSFTIVPKAINVEVKESSAIYGDSFNVTGKLQYKDSFSKVTFDLETIDSSYSNVTPRNATITDENGADVSYCYSLSYVTKKVSIRKRPITLTSESQTKQYDGSPLQAKVPTITSGTLAPGDTITYTQNPSNEIFGTSSASFEAKITNSIGKNVTEYYNITYNFGLQKIVEREISLSSASYNKVYDGQGFTNSNNYSISKGTLASGHSVLYSPTSSTLLSDPFVKNATNSFYASIYDQDSNQVNQYYNIDYNYGNIVITKRNLTIKTYNQNFTYNGYSQSSTSSDFAIINSSLASGDYISSLSFESFKYVGQYENRVNSIVIRNANNQDVTDCYDISYEYGSINLERKHLELMTSTSSSEYNGYEQGASSSNIIQLKSGYTLADNDYFSVNNNDIPKIRKVGSVNNVLPFRIYNYSSGLDVTDQYTFNITYGTFTVTKRNVTIYSKNMEKKYDGTPLEAEINSTVSSDYYYFGTSIPYIDVVQGGRIYSSSANVGYYTPLFDLTNITATNNAVGDVTNCYNFTTHANTNDFHIAARSLILNPRSISVKYDGQYHYCTEYDIDEYCDGLLPGERIEGVQFVQDAIKNVGTKTVTIDKTNIRIYNSSEQNVTSNYAISTTSGYVQITPRYITMSVPHATKVFDNRPLVFDHSHTLTGDGLAPNEHDVLTWTNDTIINVFDHASYTYRIYNGSSEDTTSNYVITYDVSLTVTRLYVQVKSFDDYYIYDGYEHTAITAGDYTLENGQSVDELARNLGGTTAFPSYIRFTFTLDNVSGTNQGIYNFSNFIQYVTAYDTELGESINIDNFSFNYMNTGLTIFKREVTVASPTVEFEYTGNEVENNLFILENSLADGDSLVYLGDMMEIKEKTDGPITNAFDLSLVRIMHGTSDVTSNYKLTKYEGKINIYSEEQE